MMFLWILLLTRFLHAEPLLEGFWKQGPTTLVFINPDKFMAVTGPTVEVGRFTTDGIKLTLTTERSTQGKKLPPMTYTFAVTDTHLMLEKGKFKTYYERVGTPLKK